MSLTSKLSVSIKKCVSFTADKLFEKARGALQDSGRLQKWTELSRNATDRTIDEIIDQPTMDSVLFLQDRFEILIDARGFRPEDVKCSLTINLVEVAAQKYEKFNAGNKSMTLTRSYQLPQPIKPEEGICCMSSEGILLISAPWLR
ncbi:major egg antigen-like [Anoplophora glabripennis]|uniref:major egg antigen-like n=1 Tax=Anoplophora glabripennis TaxID=217634 RepID=UPI000874E12F|nr:major egg antigen-like [Anoplophora glabripennis]